MRYYNMPEGPINPPEDTRKPVYTCEVCGEHIYEYDEYYDLGDLGMVCENCIYNAHKYDAELEVF